MIDDWGNPDEHDAAFEQALKEFFERHPEAPRRFIDLAREHQSWILARQVEIYRQGQAA